MDLQWFPGKEDQLIIWAQDISLYRVETVAVDTTELKPRNSIIISVFYHSKLGINISL